MRLFALIVLLVAACATPAPLPHIYPEAEAAPPHIMAAVREVAPNIALNNVSMEGEVFVIQGAMPDGDAITLHVAQLGDRWKVVSFERHAAPAANYVPQSDERRRRRDQ